MECILHQPAGCRRILFIAPEERFVHSLRPILGMLPILSFFSTQTSLSLFTESPYLCTRPFAWLHESSNRVRARVPKGIRLDKPGWIPLNFPHTSVPLPGIYQAPGRFYCPINFSSWILLGLFPTISFNYKMRDIFTHTHLLLYQSRLANSKRHGKESEPVGKHRLGTAERTRCDGSGVCCSC